MAKTKILNILVEPEFQAQLRRKAEETGIPYSEVARRAWKVWIETGELPKLPEKKGGKHKTK